MPIVDRYYKTPIQYSGHSFHPRRYVQIDFALETFWPSSDGWSAARIEEEVVVTKSGPEVITRFPAEELMVAGLRYHTATGPLSATRETQSHLNRSSDGIPAGIAGAHG